MARIPSNLPLIEEVLSPHTHLRAVRDPMIVSLDLEYNTNPPQITQLGLSILDTTRLPEVDIANVRSIAPLVSNHLFIIGKQRKRSYGYGHPHQAGSTRLDDILRPFLAIEDKRGRPRSIVLVGHTLSADLLMLQRCGLDLASLTTVRAYFDIAPACSRVFDNSSRLESLSRICWRLGIHTYSYHNAAHDALYTLQALLLLFCRYKDAELDAPFHQLDSPYDQLLFSNEQDENQGIMWQDRLETLRFVGREMGNVLWIGTTRARRREQRKQEYFRSLQDARPTVVDRVTKQDVQDDLETNAVLLRSLFADDS